jgi:hypothetical protein
MLDPQSSLYQVHSLEFGNRKKENDLHTPDQDLTYQLFEASFVGDIDTINKLTSESIYTFLLL